MPRQRTTLDELMARPGRVLGTWSQIASPDLIDALGAAGYDFTIIDCEHGAFGIETAETLIRACEAAGVVPLVRVPRGDTVALYKALDCGAVGVLAPGVSSVEEAQALVAATRLGPDGVRGACPIVRAADHAAMPWRAFEAAQAGNGVIAMIETRAGLQACEAICRVAGLKAVLVGPFDLSVALGHHGDVQHPEVVAGVERVLAAAQAAALPAWMPVFSTDTAVFQAQLAQWAARGVRHFAIGADKLVMSRAFGALIEAAR
jgi:4-hydroxy-2-oxoheptanedioate aldolase